MKHFWIFKLLWRYWIRAIFPYIDFAINGRLNDAVVFKMLIQTWSHSSDWNRYSSYSGNIHVVILKEFVF